MTGWRKRHVMEMARKAGAVFPADGSYHQFERHEDLEAFAELVRADEREACAKVCETHGVHPTLNVWSGPDWYKHAKDCAAAIRARGQA